jgi:hypothetical protein
LTTKISGATFWSIFSRTHLVSLIETFSQVLNYVKREDLLSGKSGNDLNSGSGARDDKLDAFDYCWNQSKLPRTPAKPIPGHAKPKSSGGKSPRSPKGGFSGSKSPRTPPRTPTGNNLI